MIMKRPPKRKTKSGWIAIDSKVYNDGINEGRSRNKKGLLIDMPERMEIILKPNSKFKTLLGELDKQVKATYGGYAELVNFDDKKEINEDIADFKIKYSTYDRGVLPL